MKINRIVTQALTSSTLVVTLAPNVFYLGSDCNVLYMQALNACVSKVTRTLTIGCVCPTSSMYQN